jgi:histidine triad (HIT) family protein
VRENCLFCKLVVDGNHIASTDGFVAIRDLHPQADTHLLVLPVRHIDSFHEIAEFTADEDKRMLDFIAEVAAEQGLTDYRVVVNAGAGAGQTIFHLHWHVLSGGLTGRMA